jgi:cob(I)alamin adenosyltransferase
MGCLHVYTGDGKGKTTAALGLAIRAAGAGKKVAIVQFDKGSHTRDEYYSERNILRSIHEIDFFPYGCPRIRPDGRFRRGTLPEDIEEAHRALETAHQLIRIPTYFLIILDEIITAVYTHLIEPEELHELILEYKKNPIAELVLTGRGASKALVNQADLVTEMRLVKHYFHTGRKAVNGIDY